MENAELRKLSKALQSLQTGSPDWISSEKYSATEHSQRYRDMMQLTTADLLGDAWRKYIYPEDLAHVPEPPQSPDDNWIWPVRVRVGTGYEEMVSIGKGEFRAGCLVRVVGWVMDQSRV